MSEILEIPKYDCDVPIIFYQHEGRIWTKPHWHKEIEIIYVLEGVLNLGVDGEIVRLEKGQIYLINGGINHYFLSSPGSHRLVFQLDADFFLHSHYFSHHKPLVDRIRELEVNSKDWPEESLRRMQAILDEITIELKEKKNGYNYESMGYLYLLISEINRGIPKRKKEEKLSRSSEQNLDILRKIDSIYAYIEKNYAQQLKLEDIAEHVGYSPQYFSYFFKEHTGKTFITFLNEYRLGKAKWMLITKDWTVSEIAYRSGFQSIQTFYYTFEKHMDEAPLAYRKKIRNTLDEE